MLRTRRHTRNRYRRHIGYSQAQKYFFSETRRGMTKIGYAKTTSKQKIGVWDEEGVDRNETGQKRSKNSRTLTFRGPRCSAGTHPDWALSNVTRIMVRFTTFARFVCEKNARSLTAITQKGKLGWLFTIKFTADQVEERMGKFSTFRRIRSARFLLTKQTSSSMYPLVATVCIRKTA